MLKKGKKFKLGSVEAEIISASNSGLNTCKTENAIFKLHCDVIKKLINV
jgi:hypothetical protein